MNKIINVIPTEDYKLMLTFINEEVKIFDMINYLDHGLYKELKNKNLFKTVKIAFDTIEWENGIDINPEVLYNDSIPI